MNHILTEALRRIIEAADAPIPEDRQGPGEFAYRAGVMQGIALAALQSAAGVHAANRLDGAA